ncbi:hypothetical protein BCR33DRAFT_423969 [Rhizoclosmatium globosum]|uniref:Secreted protein n=1 Tax=Rhizoclosmatium globosum TaxID=329046 RepID=A0A1Y2BW02_9FUNG|nr:hypothetical protein BCR33DRAFT_423969 [Rhizoclosmatium globosum]|eukprot:ORY38913.1 hypothetical protein BCR33DRAFT_423969 [Rhizoclosmatium globosum]
MRRWCMVLVGSCLLFVPCQSPILLLSYHSNLLRSLSLFMTISVYMEANGQLAVIFLFDAYSRAIYREIVSYVFTRKVPAENVASNLMK